MARFYYELNQYTSVKGSALSYDLNGNLKTYDGWTYHYNAHNRLVTAVKSGTTLSLTYDAIGRLASSTLNGVQTTVLYDDNELVAEYSSTGALLRRYVHGLKEDDPLVWYEGTGTTNTRYLLPDEKGSIIAETNSSGGIVTLHRYGPFGEPQNSSTSRFRYTGQILLPGTELYYYKARVYHPKLGRFMQTDPIGYEDGMNRYAYVGNDPVNKVDPDGNSAIAACAVGPVGCGVGLAITGLTILAASGSTDVDETIKIISDGSFDTENVGTNPTTGKPGCVSTCNGKTGKAKQIRIYGPDGKPETDIDVDHPHDGKKPHAHDWKDGRRAEGDEVRGVNPDEQKLIDNLIIPPKQPETSKEDLGR